MKNDSRTDSELLTLFGLALPSTRQSLKTRYHRLAQQCHPDMNPGNKSAEERFKALAEAYEVLTNRESPFIEEEAKAKTVDGIFLTDLGKGLPRNKNAKSCDQCSGKGYKTDALPGGWTECPRCHGACVLREDKCHRCNGTGKYTHPNTGKIVGECHGCKGTGTYKFVKPVPCGHCRVKESPMEFIMWGFLQPRRNSNAGPSYRSTGRVQTNVMTYRVCSTCKGTGETELDNPVLPRNRIF